MKMSMKKRVLMLLVVVSTAMFTYGQSAGDMAIGVNLSYGFKDHFNTTGLGAKMQWGLTDAIRLEPSATYFFEKNNVNLWDVNFNAHYLVPVAEKFYIYPLAGVSLLGVSYDASGVDGDTKFGINLGAGAETPLTDRLSLNLELKYQIVSDWNRPVLSLGLAYKF